MTVLVQAANIHYAHGGNQIFAGVTLEVKRGERLAIVGENGAGKSTLLKLLARAIAPDQGSVVHQRGLTVGMLDQRAEPDPTQTVREVVAEALGDPDALDAKLDAIEAAMAEAPDDEALMALLDEQAAVLARLDGTGDGLDDAKGEAILAGLRIPNERWDTAIGNLSGGERRLVALARLLAEEPELLLLDEPDNHLDDDGRAWLEGFIVAHRGAVVIVTHDRYLIDRTATRIVEIEDGHLTPYPGNYTTYRTEKRNRLARLHQLRVNEEREFQKLKQSAENLTQWARQNPKFANRAEAQRRKLAEERERLEATAPPPLERRRIEMTFAAERGSTLVLEASGVTKAFGERTVFKPFDLVIRHGERVGLVGPNGAGKTTFLRMVLGKLQPDSGTLRLGPSIVPGYFAQEQETLDPKQTPLALVRSLAPLDEHRSRSFLSGLGFDAYAAETPIGQLSGGERSRLQLGALVLGGANFLILDEPTNNLDVASIEVLEEAFSDFGGTLLTVSHDRYFLGRVCGRIIELRDGEVRDYPGSYDDYARMRAAGQPGTLLTHRAPEPVGANRKRQRK